MSSASAGELLLSEQPDHIVIDADCDEAELSRLLALVGEDPDVKLSGVDPKLAAWLSFHVRYELEQRQAEREPIFVGWGDEEAGAKGRSRAERIHRTWREFKGRVLVQEMLEARRGRVRPRIFVRARGCARRGRRALLRRSPTRSPGRRDDPEPLADPEVAA